MTTMTDEEKKKIAETVGAEIALVLTRYKIDFYSLDSVMRNAFVEVFQLGVRFIPETYGGMGNEPN